MSVAENKSLNGSRAISASADGRERPSGSYDLGRLTVPASGSAVGETKEGEGPQSARPGIAKQAIPVYRRYRQRLDAILDLASGLVGLDDESFAAEWAGVSAQMDEELTLLRDLPHGEGEALKRVVAVVSGIVRNAVWERGHAKYLIAVAQELKRVYHPKDETAIQISRLAKDFGLDRFRGTVSEGTVRKRYKLVELPG